MAEITHFSHEHPLILRKQFPKVNVDGYVHLCYFCDPESSRQEVENEGDHVDAYVCELCKKFFLHKSCAELPREILYSSHQRHPLVLSKKSKGQHLSCKLCDYIINNVFYSCDLCEYQLHIRCALRNKNSVIHYDDKNRTLIHESHKENSLWLFPRPATVLCDACDSEKQDYFYHCSSCWYQMHRHCAFLPSTTNRKDHPHPLSLSFSLPSQYHSFDDFFCDICQCQLDKRQKNWLYYCQLCRVQYDEGDIIYLPTADKSMDLIKRSLLGDKEFVDIPQEIQIFSHKQHPLILSNEQITEDVIEDDEEILCDGCIEPISSPPYYHCAQCRYFLHLPCANLPSKLQDPIKLDPTRQIRYYRHPQHPFTLSHEQIAKDVIEDQDEILCQHCFKPISSPPYYHCAQCRYFLHLPCANLPTKLQDPIKLINPPEQIQYYRHEKHPFVLSIDEDVIEDEKCYDCFRPIYSLPNYGCVKCGYFIHLQCGLRHPNTEYLVIPYPPTLGSKSRFYEYFQCYNCFRYSNGFFFYNKVNDNLKYHLDVKCAALLSLKTVVIKHESHDHPLVPEYAVGRRKHESHNYNHCAGCNGSTASHFIFTCRSCIFKLHYECLMLPKTTRHRYDSNHPLILKFPPHTYHGNPFDCAACEKEIHPRFWLYHCEECDLSFHIKCINPQLGRFKFGQKLKVTSHSHTLKFVMEAAVKSPCHNCGNDIDLDFVFECEICNFHLCRKCVLNIELTS